MLTWFITRRRLIAPICAVLATTQHFASAALLVKNESTVLSLERAAHVDTISKEAVDGDRIHVVYSATNDGTNFLALLASMVSLARHTKVPGRCVIHLIVPKEDIGSTADLARCFATELQSLGVAAVPQVEVHAMHPPPFSMTKDTFNPKLQGGEKMQATFARLFVSEYLEGIPKAVWIDCDTIVLDDVEELWHKNISKGLAAKSEGVPMGNMYYQNLPSTSFMKMYAPKKALNFNAGVLVIDLDNWRKKNFLGVVKFWAGVLLKEGVGVNDQLLINLVFNTHQGVNPLGWEWNILNIGWPQKYPCFDYEYPHENGTATARVVKLLHFSGPHKPQDDGRCAVWERYRPKQCKLAPGRSVKPNTDKPIDAAAYLRRLQHLAKANHDKERLVLDNQ